MGIKFGGWGRESKADRIKRLEDENVSLENRITNLRDEKIDREIANGRLDQNNKATIHDLETYYEREIRNISTELNVFKENYDIDLNNAVVDAENKAEKKEQDFEKAFNKRVIELEREHAVKIGKCDKDLELDKISYRKFFREDRNEKMATLESENKKLSLENATLKGENKSLEGWNNFCTGKQEQVLETVGLIIKALPVVSANITTPEVVVQMPKQEQAKQNGGIQQK